MEPVDSRSDIRTTAVEATAAEVFAAISDARRLARWWGPDGFSSTVHQFEFRPGGLWRMTLHGPDGQDHPNDYRLLGFEQDRWVELDHPSSDHHFVLRIDLRQEGDQTVVSWRQTFDTVHDYRVLADFLAAANVQVLARLAAEAGAEERVAPVARDTAGPAGTG